MPPEIDARCWDAPEATNAASPAAIREAYLKNLQEFLNYCRKQCQSSGVDYCLVNTSKPLDEALSSYISKRGRGF